jgi:hypothetical protein
VIFFWCLLVFYVPMPDSMTGSGIFLYHLQATKVGAVENFVKETLLLHQGLEPVAFGTPLLSAKLNLPDSSSGRASAS